MKKRKFVLNELDHKKNVYLQKHASSFFENAQIITTSCIITSPHEMTMNKRFNILT